MSERDIVERLEDIRIMVNYGNGIVGDEPEPRAVEARAEILRLRAELASRAVPTTDEPVTYAYVYPASFGGDVVRYDTDGREINGSKPTKVLPLYYDGCGPECERLRAELAARAVPDEEVVAAIADAALEAWTTSHYDEDGDAALSAANAALREMRAAGFTVIRTEVRDGGE